MTLLDWVIFIGAALAVGIWLHVGSIVLGDE